MNIEDIPNNIKGKTISINLEESNYYCNKCGIDLCVDYNCCFIFIKNDLCKSCIRHKKLKELGI